MTDIRSLLSEKNSDTRLENGPLSGDDTLDEDTEEEEERLVHGGQVHTNVKGEQEHKLHEEAGVDEDVGDARAEPDQDTRGGRLLSGVDNSLRHDTIRDLRLEAVRGHRILL